MFHALRAADLRAALDCLGAIIEATAADRSFARQGVASLGRLVASDLTTLSICDLETGHRSVVSDVPGAISKRDVETTRTSAAPRSTTTTTAASASTARWPCRSTCIATCS
jgi:hypothetical protein